MGGTIEGAWGRVEVVGWIDVSVPVRALLMGWVACQGAVESPRAAQLGIDRGATALSAVMIHPGYFFLSEPVSATEERCTGGLPFVLEMFGV